MSERDQIAGLVQVFVRMAGGGLNWSWQDIADTLNSLGIDNFMREGENWNVEDIRGVEQL